MDIPHTKQAASCTAPTEPPKSNAPRSVRCWWGGYLPAVIGGGGGIVLAWALVAVVIFNVGVSPSGEETAGNGTDADVERLKAAVAKQHRPEETNAAPPLSTAVGGTAAAAKLQQRDQHPAKGKERDRQLRAAILGEWELADDGTYRLTIRPDSTGTLIYHPNFKYKVLLGWTDRLEIQIRWSLENGHVDMQSVTGKPKRAFKIAIEDRGKRKYYCVQRITPKRLVLRNVKNGDTDVWRKVH